jgi:hypothetical protein
MYVLVDALQRSFKFSVGANVLVISIYDNICVSINYVCCDGVKYVFVISIYDNICVLVRIIRDAAKKGYHKCRFVA